MSLLLLFEVHIPHTGYIFQQSVTVSVEHDRTDLRERLMATKSISDALFQAGNCSYCEIQIECMHIRKYRKTTRQVSEDIPSTIILYHNIDNHKPNAT